VNRVAHEVHLDDIPISLTPTEFRLLDIFAANTGRVFTREQLIDKISPGGTEIYDRTLDRHIANLRKKIEPDILHPSYIVTVIGSGYKFVEPK